MIHVLKVYSTELNQCLYEYFTCKHALTQCLKGIVHQKMKGKSLENLRLQMSFFILTDLLLLLLYEI